jgi:hypothetical protein
MDAHNLRTEDHFCEAMKERGDSSRIVLCGRSFPVVN